MATRKRITQQERERRDAAYREWAKRDRDFTAAASALGIEEKELRRWAGAHRWYHRSHTEFMAEIDRLKQASKDIDQLKPLIDGIGVDGKPLYVPTEMRLDAIKQAIDVALSLGPVKKQLPGFGCRWGRRSCADEEV